MQLGPACAGSVSGERFEEVAAAVEKGASAMLASEQWEHKLGGLTAAMVSRGTHGG
jgi:hypothetical protein